MSTQIAVRLPDELVDYIDGLVGAGAGSRAAVVARALVNAFALRDDGIG
jgi:Arc/MetJ-type ribon-helix-helix transcriptional regulator